MDILQLVDPDTLLLVYKNNYVHLKGRDGNPGDRAIITAKKVIERLEKVCLAGIWYDCKNPNLEVYLVAEPGRHPYPDYDKTPENLYGRIFGEARTALMTISQQEEGQSISGCLAEYWYTGGADYEHQVNKFYGRFGLLRGLATFQDSRITDFESTTTWLSHPFEVKVYPYEKFEEVIAQPPRGRFGIGDALRWGLIKPDDLRRFMKDNQ